jgi:hypothetical protein
MFFPWTGTTEAAKDTTTTTLAAAEVVTLADEVNPLKNFLDQDKISILAISETHVKTNHGLQISVSSEINPLRSGGVAPKTSPPLPTHSQTTSTT